MSKISDITVPMQVIFGDVLIEPSSWIYGYITITWSGEDGVTYLVSPKHYYEILKMRKNYTLLKVIYGKELSNN